MGSIWRIEGEYEPIETCRSGGAGDSYLEMHQWREHCAAQAGVGAIRRSAAGASAGARLPSRIGKFD